MDAVEDVRSRGASAKACSVHLPEKPDGLLINIRSRLPPPHAHHQNRNGTSTQSCSPPHSCTSSALQSSYTPLHNIATEHCTRGGCCNQSASGPPAISTWRALSTTRCMLLRRAPASRTSCIPLLSLVLLHDKKCLFTTINFQSLQSMAVTACRWRWDED